MADYPTATLNCIDLSNPDIQQSAALLKQACLDSGFFYVTNHGISEEFMNDVFTQSKKFFGLPMNEKEMLVKEGKNRGYKNFLPKTNPKTNYAEIYRMGVDLPEADPNANIWPSDDVLPGWKEMMLTYYKEALNVARRVARILALALEVSFDFFDQPKLFGESVSNLFLLHYSGQIIDPSKEAIGAVDHTDFGLITLLATNVLGLQICKDKYAKPQLWEYVPIVKGAFIVNLGDILERFSNDAFRSTVHRVIFRGEEKYSLSFFLYPSLDCVIECLPAFKSEENPVKYPPITCGEFLKASYEKVTLRF